MTDLFYLHCSGLIDLILTLNLTGLDSALFSLHYRYSVVVVVFFFSLVLLPTESYLLFRFLWYDPEPVSNHAEHCSEVRQTHQNPKPYHRFIIIQVLYLRATWTDKETYRVNRQFVLIVQGFVLINILISIMTLDLYSGWICQGNGLYFEVICQFQIDYLFSW